MASGRQRGKIQKFHHCGSGKFWCCLRNHPDFVLDLKVMAAMITWILQDLLLTFKPMHPDIVLFAILLLVILSISFRVLYYRTRKQHLSHRWIESIKHIGQISLAIGLLLQLVELSAALTHLTGQLTTTEIALGLESTVHVTMHGLGVYITGMILFVALNLTRKGNS